MLDKDLKKIVLFSIGFEPYGDSHYHNGKIYVKEYSTSKLYSIDIVSHEIEWVKNI